MKLGVVILNYNDFPHTKAILEQLKRDPLAEGVVVVDNASTDGSPDRLLPYCTGKMRLLKVKKNGGYARGNNAGIRYLIKWMQPDVIAIANPDLVLPEGFLSAVRMDFAEHPEYSALTGVQKIPGGEDSYFVVVTRGHLSESPLTPFEFACFLLLDPLHLLLGVGLAVGAVPLDSSGHFHDYSPYDEWLENC